VHGGASGNSFMKLRRRRLTFSLCLGDGFHGLTVVSGHVITRFLLGFVEEFWFDLSIWDFILKRFFSLRLQATGSNWMGRVTGLVVW